MKKIVLYFIFLVSLTSCEDFFTATKEIDLEEYAGQVTVIGRLSNTDVSNELARTQLSYGVLVTRSRSVLDTSNFPLIENADIRLSSDEGVDINFEFNEKTGYYFPPNNGNSRFEGISVEENTHYELTVDVPGEERLSSSCETKTFGVVNDIKIIKNDIDGGGGSTLDRIQIQVDDPVGENYYYLNVFYEGLSYFEKGYLYSYSSIFDDSPELFSDELFDGKTEVLEFWSERYDKVRESEIDRVKIILWSLSKEEYDFRTSLIANEIARDNPFAEPSIVFSNIENGVGIFSMSNAERIITPWE